MILCMAAATTAVGLESSWIVVTQLGALQRSPLQLGFLRVYVIGETSMDDSEVDLRTCVVVQPEYGLGAWLLARLVRYDSGMTHGNHLLYHRSPDLDLDLDLDIFLQS